MSDMSETLVQPFRRLLADSAPPSLLRAVEAGADHQTIWDAIEESGFLDAMVPEDKGGSGLTLDDVFPLVAATGEYVLPVPFAETMVARALLADVSDQIPSGALIVLAAPSSVIPLVRAASHALQSNGDRLELVAITEPGFDAFGTLGGQMHGEIVLTAKQSRIDLALPAAALKEEKMAGAMHRILDMTLQYVGQRHQFGRPLSKFQAIQQQMAVMAELVTSAHIAARIAMSGTQFETVRVAMAKCHVSQASHQIVAIAHAVHGAIGVTQEYDLQLYTRRIKEWQLAFGSEDHWARRLGQARLAKRYENSADFVRIELSERTSER